MKVKNIHKRPNNKTVHTPSKIEKPSPAITHVIDRKEVEKKAAIKHLIKYLIILGVFLVFNIGYFSYRIISNKEISLNNQTGGITETTEYHLHKEKQEVDALQSSEQVKQRPTLPGILQNSMVRQVISLLLLIFAGWKWFSFFTDFKPENALMSITVPAIMTFWAMKWQEMVPQIIAWFS